MHLKLSINRQIKDVKHIRTKHLNINYFHIPEFPRVQDEWSLPDI